MQTPQSTYSSKSRIAAVHTLVLCVKRCMTRLHHSGRLTIACPTKWICRHASCVTSEKPFMTSNCGTNVNLPATTGLLRATTEAPD